MIQFSNVNIKNLKIKNYAQALQFSYQKKGNF